MVPTASSKSPNQPGILRSSAGSSFASSFPSHDSVSLVPVLSLGSRLADLSLQQDDVIKPGDRTFGQSGTRNVIIKKDGVF